MGASYLFPRFKKAKDAKDAKNATPWELAFLGRRDAS
jgi:hypothetical protein